MTKDEFNELYIFLRQEVSAAGFSQLDQVIDMYYTSHLEGKNSVEKYIEKLLKMLKERNAKIGDSILDLLNYSIETKSGKPIKDIEVSFTEEEARRYNRKSENIRKGRDYSALISRIESFSYTLSNTPENSPRGPSNGPSFP
ncbi:hypothetical protein K0L52_003232 [Vibrio fluvialis]|nr:hypothetical protein [Vibrio fluvialis]